MSQLKEELLDMIAEMEGEDSTKKAWNPDLLKRIINRLASLSDCPECQAHLQKLGEHVRALKGKLEHMEKDDYKQHGQVLQGIVAHLQEVHGLVSEPHYMSMYLPLGMCFGLVFGMTVFDNLALGMGMGMCLGLVVGSAMDADLKKKDKII